MWKRFASLQHFQQRILNRKTTRNRFLFYPIIWSLSRFSKQTQTNQKQLMISICINFQLIIIFSFLFLFSSFVLLVFFRTLVGRWQWSSPSFFVLPRLIYYLLHFLLCMWQCFCFCFCFLRLSLLVSSFFDFNYHFRHCFN